MELRINGEMTNVPAALSLVELLEHLKLKSDRVAVELNRQIVRRDQWPATLLKERDQVEIVQFVGGG
jgi:sulfur carrier protein